MDQNSQAVSKVTVPVILERKLRGEKVTCVTAYDYSAARLVDEAGIEMILVGDSLAQAVLGYDSTVPVTVEEMLHHLRAVRRGVRRALLIVDLPYGSYHVSDEQALASAIRFLKEGGAEAVKLEGGRKRARVGAKTRGSANPRDGAYRLDAPIRSRPGRLSSARQNPRFRYRTSGGCRSSGGSGSFCRRPGRNPARTRRHYHPPLANSHHRNRRGPRLRWPSAGVSRSGRTQLCCRPPSSCAATPTFAKCFTRF